MSHTVTIHYVGYDHPPTVFGDIDSIDFETETGILSLHKVGQARTCPPAYIIPVNHNVRYVEITQTP